MTLIDFCIYHADLFRHLVRKKQSDTKNRKHTGSDLMSFYTDTKTNKGTNIMPKTKINRGGYEENISNTCRVCFIGFKFYV
jgi:hypothetical protein